MPVEVVGLREAQKAMRSLQPDLDKELKKQMRLILKPILAKAKGYVKESPLPGLSQWSAYNDGLWTYRYFNAGKVRAGIRAELSPSRHKNTGFVSLVRIVNLTPAGAIYETAGRLNPGGKPRDPNGPRNKFSHSRNPDAGMHFINSIGGQLAGRGLKRGRLIYRAMDEDQGRVTQAIINAIKANAAKSARYVDAARAFKKVA